MSANQETIPENERRFTAAAMAACGALILVGAPVVGSLVERAVSGQDPCVRVEDNLSSEISSTVCRVRAAILNL